ncbi:MAG: hypothetical protein M1834_008643 [Cirrosporium novae-zelandiae]|nr:MAG: hypothetical protein M1834_008643 [Cirrosporium novae-zelandiae]
MASAKKYDCVIIGSGQGGTPLAGAFAKAGQKTALIERSHIGGCCVNEGCTPTKTMIASGRVAYLTRRRADYGVHTPEDNNKGRILVDMKKVRQRKRDIVDIWRGGGEARTRSAGVDVLMGDARFDDPKTLTIKLNDGSEMTVSADKIFINAGERPAKPKLEGVDTIPADLILDSTSIQEVGEVPQQLIILGGGYVGLEFGQLFRRLGSNVTIIQRGPQLLPREDPDIAEEMLKILREDGIMVHLSTVATHVSSPSAGTISLTISSSSDSHPQTVIGTHLLSAAGRVPNTDTLNLSVAGVEVSPRGYVVTNPQLETNVPHIYAMGDVKGPPAFTHISYDDFRILRDNLIDRKSSLHTVSHRMIPYVVYTDPQLGHVGVHEGEVRKLFPDRQIKVAKMPMAYVARAVETDEPRGLMKAIVDADSGLILGFTCLGLEGGEIMSIMQTAMMGGLRYERLQDAIWAHPTLAESLNNLWGYLE